MGYAITWISIIGMLVAVAVITAIYGVWPIGLCVTGLASVLVVVGFGLYIHFTTQAEEGQAYVMLGFMYLVALWAGFVVGGVTGFFL